jgi:CDP-diglyceride synthetase
MDAQMTKRTEALRLLENQRKVAGAIDIMMGFVIVRFCPWWVVLLVGLYGAWCFTDAMRRTELDRLIRKGNTDNGN